MSLTPPPSMHKCPKTSVGIQHLDKSVHAYVLQRRKVGYSERGCSPILSPFTTSQAPTTQRVFLTTDDFAVALGALPPDDWSRTWAPGKTIMLKMISKRVNEVVDKIRLPVVVHLSRRFWYDTRNDTEKGKSPVRSETTHIHDSVVTYHHTRTGLMCNEKTTYRVAFRRSVGTVPSAGAP